MAAKAGCIAGQLHCQFCIECQHHRIDQRQFQPFGSFDQLASFRRFAFISWLSGCAFQQFGSVASFRQLYGFRSFQWRLQHVSPFNQFTRFARVFQFTNQHQFSFRSDVQQFGDG